MSRPITNDKLGVAHVESGDGVNGKTGFVSADYVPGTIEEKRLVRKIDLHLLPILWGE